MHLALNNGMSSADFRSCLCVAIVPSGKPIILQRKIKNTIFTLVKSAPEIIRILLLVRKIKKKLHFVYNARHAVLIPENQRI